MNERGKRRNECQANRPRVQVRSGGRPRCGDHEEP